MATAIR